jgi:hypothetical protein
LPWPGIGRVRRQILLEFEDEDEDEFEFEFEGKR